MSLSFRAFFVSFNIIFTISKSWLSVRASKLIISSTLFKNSGRKTSFNLSITLFLSIVCFPNPIEFVFVLEPAFDVIIIIVFAKLTLFPWLSVNLPSSSTCNRILKTSGCAFSISSNKIIE